jgi:hypothetical protein
MSLKVIAFGMALALIAAPGYAQVRGLGGFRGPVVATPPSVVAPYRFSPPPSTMAPADQQEMLNYRTQLQGQEQDLRNLQSQRQLGPTGRQELRDTQNELNRLNNEIQP